MTRSLGMGHCLTYAESKPLSLKIRLARGVWSSGVSRNVTRVSSSSNSLKPDDRSASTQSFPVLSGSGIDLVDASSRPVALVILPC